MDKKLTNVVRPFSLNLKRDGKMVTVQVEAGVQHLAPDVAGHWFSKAHLGPMPEPGSNGGAEDAQRSVALDLREAELAKREAAAIERDGILDEREALLADRENLLRDAEQALTAPETAASGGGARKGSGK